LRPGDEDGGEVRPDRRIRLSLGVRVSILSERIEDNRVRELVESLKDDSTILAASRSKEVADDSLTSALNAMTLLNRRIGELLRSSP
jgi:hypothetical protein